MKLNVNYKDFLCDDLFVYWRIHPTEELTAFWEKFISENEHLREPFQEAISAFDEIRQEQDRLRLDEASVNRQLQERIRQFRMRKLRTIYTSAAAILLLTLITVFYTVMRKEAIPDQQIASIGEVMSPDKVQLITGNQVVDMGNNATVQLSEKENAVIRDSLSQKEIDLKDNQTIRLIVPLGKIISPSIRWFNGICEFR